MKYKTKVYESGWVTIPTQLTDFFVESTYIITRGTNDCIFIFNMEGWRKLYDILRTLSDEISTRKVQRLLIAMAMEITIEQQSIQMPECYISLLGNENIDIHLVSDVPFTDVVILKKENYIESDDNGYDVEKNVRLLLSLYNACEKDSSYKQ